MNRLKQLDQRLIVRAFDRQVEEVQILAAILNRFTAHGRSMAKSVASIREA